jgi:hypothetical protein
MCIVLNILHKSSAAVQMGRAGNIASHIDDWFACRIYMGPAINIDKWYLAGHMGPAINMDECGLVGNMGPAINIDAW